jgi:Zn-dependent protease with chaperone function
MRSVFVVANSICINEFEELASPGVDCGRGDLWSLKPTRKEKMEKLAIFGLVGALLTASAVHCHQFPYPIMTFLLTGGSEAYKLFKSPFKYTSETPSASNHEKFEELRRAGDEYCRRLGMKKPVQLRILRKDSIDAGALLHRGQKVVAIRDQALTEQDVDTLKGILGHEIAHLANKHIKHSDLLLLSLAMGMDLFLASASAGYPLASGISQFATPILIYKMHRAHEFQADRIGAAVSGEPRRLAEYLRGNGLDSNQTWERFEERLSRREKAIYMATMVPKSLFYLYAMSHPSAERRVERLETMRNPPKRYKTDRLKSRLKQVLFLKL